MDASDYLDHLVADTRPHFASQATSQSPFEAQQRLGHATSQPLHSGLSIAVTDSVLPTTSWPNFESTEQFNTEPYIGHRQFPSSQQLARLPFNGHQSHIPPSNLHTSFVSNSETNHQGHQDQSQSQISGILGQDLVQESTAYQWPARMPSNALWLTSSSPPIAPLGRPALETLMAQLQLEAHLANEKAQLADKRAQMAEQRTRQAEKKAQKLEKQCNEQLSIIHRLRGTVSPSRLMSPRSADDKANPALFSTPVRTDTGGSTESDLSGITAPDPGDPGTVEDFIADVQSNAINESEQDLHGVQYLLEAEEDSSIPRAEHAKRSLDSGYGTNRTDDGANQFVRPSDTILSPVDPSLLYPHT
jgi:hypothetical protein